MGHEQAHVKPDRLVWKREDHTFGKLSSVSTALGSLSTGTETGVGDMLGFLQSMDNPPMTPAEDKVFMQIWDDPPAEETQDLTRRDCEAYIRARDGKPFARPRRHYPVLA